MKPGCLWNVRRHLGLLTLAPLLAGTARAVVFIADVPTSHNTTAPAGPLADGGWDLQGSWGGLTGTPIAPNFFLTAKHAGGAVGSAFQLGGVNYTTVAQYPHPTADLQLWEISGSFPEYAAIHTGADEVGKEALLFGRSPVRGDAVIVPGTSPDELGGLRGWQWGGSGHALRWGQNVIDQTYTTPEGNHFLLAGFDYVGLSEEATLAAGDSGGGLFLEEGGVWKLAGINVAVVADFRTDPDVPASAFSAIFDMGGLYVRTANGYELVPDETGNLPAPLYSVRLSSYQDWIGGITAVPEPTGAATVAAVVVGGLGLRRWLLRRAGR